MLAEIRKESRDILSAALAVESAAESPPRQHSQYVVAPLKVYTSDSRKAQMYGERQRAHRT